MTVKIAPNSYPDQFVAQLVRAAIGANPGSGGGGGFAPGYLYVAVPAGETDNLAPGPSFPGTPDLPITRLDIAPSSGATNITGLTAGLDGQLVLIFNSDSSSSLTLNNQNGFSASANQFQGAGDFILPPMTGILICYYAGTINKWRFIP